MLVVRQSLLIHFAAFVVLLGASTQATGTRAPVDSALERRTSEVAALLRCPVCQGLSVQDSPSELGQELRDVVREQLRSGKSEAQVKAYFVERYGEWILLRPQPSGFNRLLYFLPFGAVLAGALVVVLAVRKWTRADSGPEPVSGDGA
jgi:cytochrome c-type biogenesis protein CcmH/NrfF